MHGDARLRRAPVDNGNGWRADLFRPILAPSPTAYYLQTPHDFAIHPRL